MPAIEGYNGFGGVQGLQTPSAAPAQSSNRSAPSQSDSSSESGASRDGGASQESGSANSAPQRALPQGVGEVINITA